MNARMKNHRKKGAKVLTKYNYINHSCIRG